MTELGRVNTDFTARYFESALPTHKAGLTLENNPHLAFYQSVEDYTIHSGGREFWVSDASYRAAIESNSFWALHWYPETPVGFCSVYAHTLEQLLRHISS